jgi:hypothetical protein
MANGENLLDRLKAAIENHHQTLNSMRASQNAGADVVAASAQVEQLTRYQVAEVTGEQTPGHTPAYDNPAVSATRFK